ncbi:MAG: type III secretion system outer membrane ring subunit SctC [Burkholderiales bacterium]|nr:type III secretion system outer membrane ring subunit SctC [Burkholderiales bacterium]
MSYVMKVFQHLCLYVILALSMVVSVEAAPMPWKRKNFEYIAENQKVSEVIREFAASQGVPAVVAPEIDGTVNAKFNLPPARMMDVLAATFSLVWYYDGSVLHVYPASVIKTELLRLNKSKVEELQQSLERLKIYDARFPIMVDSVQGTIVVSGPPRYVDMVSEVAKVVAENADRTGEATIRVFPLKYAWASDTVLTQSGQDVVIPGVAQTLAAMFDKRGNNAVGPAKRNTNVAMKKPNAQSLNKLRGTGLDIEIPDSNFKQEALSLLGTQNDESFDTGLPRFRADSVRNVIIVRDYPDRMQMYEKLIEELDVMPGLVEIEAQIIEITSSALEEIGVEWRAFINRSIDVQIGSGRRPQLRQSSATTESAPNPRPTDDQLTPKGGMFTILSGDARKFLMARINAQETAGSARTLSRPRVLTLDNVQALLEDRRQVYVRVAGNLEVGLFNVSAGTSMRVTPLIVREKEGNRVKLSVRIEDGNILQEGAVDQIPATRSSSIGTQAFINEGQSLLIAGYSVDSEVKTNTGVPGLSKIPGLGALFRSESNTIEKSERLFLITPRLVNL